MSVRTSPVTGKSSRGRHEQDHRGNPRTQAGGPAPLYAYTIADAAHTGLLKVGQTTGDVKQRVAEQLKTAAIKNYTIELDEFAKREDGSIFSDHEVRAVAGNARKDLEAKSGKPVLSRANYLGLKPDGVVAAIDAPARQHKPVKKK